MRDGTGYKDSPLYYRDFYYIKYRYYIGSGWFPNLRPYGSVGRTLRPKARGPQLEIIDYQLEPPTPEPDPQKPHYRATKTYFSNQLVSTFSNLHQNIAELKEDGTINWKTTKTLT